MIKKFIEYMKFESLMDKDYHTQDKRVLNDFISKIYKFSEVNGRYILEGQRDELKDFVGSIRKYNKGEITKKQLTKKFVSFLKLLGITVPTIVHSVITIAIILSFKKWGLERYLPDAFQKQKNYETYKVI